MEKAMLKYWTSAPAAAISQAEKEGASLDSELCSEVMTKFTFEELQAENLRLQDLVISLTAALLRNIARECRAATDADAEHLLREAEDCFRYLREAEDCFRYARIQGLKKEIADGLEAAGHEFMAKAVEIETILQREKWKE